MKRLTLLLSAIILIIVTACAPATALPTETLTTTATATPAPTKTPASTLEPWMQSLPENVVSVEMDGEQLFGLDSQGNRIMKYSLDSGRWEEAMLTVEAIQAGSWGGREIVALGDGSYEMVGVPDLKVWGDGTVEVEYGSKEMTFGYENVVKSEGALTVGGFLDYEEGGWALAPGYRKDQIVSGEYQGNGREIVIPVGLGEERRDAVIESIFEMRDLMMSPELAASEFTGISVKGDDNFNEPARSWQLYRAGGSYFPAGIQAYVPKINRTDVVVDDMSSEADGRPMQVALDAEAYIPVVWEVSGDGNEPKQVRTMQIPIVVYDETGFYNLSGLIPEEVLPRVAPFLKNKETRGALAMWLFNTRGNAEVLTSHILSSPEVLGLGAGYNNRHFLWHILQYQRMGRENMQISLLR